MKNITINKETLKNFYPALEYEWIITNGLGGFASSSAAGANTRKYHGLLIASLNPPVDRYLLLSKIEEEISTGGEEYFLSANLYSNKVIQPNGHLYLEKFELDPLPAYYYKIGEDIDLTKKIFMVHGENTVIINYKLERCSSKIAIRLYPLVTFRDFHSNTDASAPGFKYEISGGNKKIKIAFSDERKRTADLFIYSDRAVFKRNEIFNRGFLLNKEVERGENAVEDSFSPGRFTAILKEGESVYIIASCEEKLRYSPLKHENLERARIASLIERSPLRSDFAEKLTYNLDSFIVERRATESKTLIAGYHWFSDWGRDTMISLTGACLATGRYDTCREILTTFIKNIKNGLVPNRFADDSHAEPEYNSVDASLWFFQAVYAYYQYSDDMEFIRSALMPLGEIIKHYMSGTDYKIKMDESDSLISCGDENVQLSWMDAKVNGYVVTPRHGKPVEINALWYNALNVYKYLYGICNVNFDKALDEIITKVKFNFRKKFVNVSEGWLYDVIGRSASGEIGTDSLKIRPNQIFAVSLPYSPLCYGEAKKVVECVEELLLTDYGLRSLAPSDPDYKPRYEGGRYARDCAYHQGTVWAYLIGAFISAKMRVENYSGESKNFAIKLLEKFERHLNEAGLLCISEIFDAEPPQRPAGCISQAWSAAELLRALHEDIGGARRLPPLESQ